MRVAFLGNGAFGIPTFQALARSPHEIISLVTRPDTAAGRGRKQTATALKPVAEEYDVPIMEIEDLRAPDTLERLAGIEALLWVVVAFPIIPSELLTIPSAGVVNLHASLLPRYRGAAPIQWAIINGETTTGVTTFFIDAGIDTGGICLQRKVGIEPDENAEALSLRLADTGARLMLETVDLIAAGSAPRVPQDTTLATPAPSFTRKDGRIDWEMAAEDIGNRIRGLHPWPGSYSTIRGERLLVLKARVTTGRELPWDEETHPAPGTLAGFLSDGAPVISTGDGKGVVLLEIQREGRRPGDAVAVMRGMRCEAGERFGDDG
ncbi:methionyl-tRNA formyltransferase [Gemmatimonadota bacterium]